MTAERTERPDAQCTQLVLSPLSSALCPGDGAESGELVAIARHDRMRRPARTVAREAGSDMIHVFGTKQPRAILVNY
jgi:hypothetical protein